MSYKVNFLEFAEHDLFELKKYIIQQFSKESWLSCYAQIKKSLQTIQQFPDLGSVPEELLDLNLNQYRQVISGKNRIIYEIQGNIIYIHLICDVRRSLSRLLEHRLLSAG